MNLLISLSSRALLLLTGADARPFLQGMITNDIQKLAPEKPLYGALLSPQGKFLHDFFLSVHGEGILLECDRARQADLMGRLNLYKLRSNVRIAPFLDWQVYAWLAGDAPPAEGLSFCDPRFPALGQRVYAPVQEAQGEERYHAHRIALGVPESGHELVPEKTLVLDVGLDRLHGVDFAKGCYVGQEVTARMHYRGVKRKGLYILSADAPLSEGMIVKAGEKEIGRLTSAHDTLGLAVLKSEEMDAPLTAGGTPVKASLPAWWE